MGEGGKAVCASDGDEEDGTQARASRQPGIHPLEKGTMDPEKLLVQVMETSKTVLGPEHPDTLTSMGNLVSTHRNQGRL